jgi:acyl carrier protein
MMSLLSNLNSVFQDVFDDPCLTVEPKTTPDDLPDWDSVAQVKLVLAIEEMFSIRFTSDELSSIHSVAGFMEAIAKLKGLEK